MSLVEVVAALGILSVAILGMVYTQIFTLRASNHSKGRQIAVQACRSHLNQARFQLRQNFSANPQTAGWQNEAVTSLPSLQYLVQEVTPNPNPWPDLKVIEVSVRWNDRQGDHSYQLTTALHKDP